MKRPDMSARRIFAVAAASVIGAAASIALATPAFAHHTDIFGTAKCDLANATWEVTWYINNSEPDKTAVLTDVTVDPDGSAITNDPIEDGTEMPADAEGFQWELTGHQTFPGTEQDATLTLDLVTWSNEETEQDSSRTIEFRGSCSPLYTVKHECDKLVFTLEVPGEGNKDVHFKLTPNEGDVQERTLEPGDDPETVQFPGKPGLDVTIEIWKTHHQNDAQITETETVTVEGATRSIVHEPKVWSKKITWEKPATCATTPPLAQTGTPIGGVVGFGAGLLVLGGGLVGLFLFLRRRRSNLTAA